MPLRLRNILPWLVAAAWIWGTWYFALSAPPVRDLLARDVVWTIGKRYPPWALVGWLATMMALMLIADRLFCRFASRWWGIDPRKVHWSRLRNRDGLFLCPECGSPFLLPPEDLADEGLVHCGDCGHAVAPYGEMKPYFPEILEAYQAAFARRLR